MSDRPQYTPEEYALEAIMKGALRHWPSDVEPDGTNTTVVITLAQAKIIREAIRDRAKARHWLAWNARAAEVLTPSNEESQTNGS